MKPKIGLVVPSLAHGGGVPAVARFIKDAIVRSGSYDLQLVSLATRSDDPCSVLMTAPPTWFRGVRSTQGLWNSLPYVHAGAYAGELEFQRYRPRKALTELLADCDLIQVVSGSPAWANSVIGLGKPVAMHVATRARVERRQRDTAPRSLAGWWRKGMTEITDKMDDRALRRVDAIQVMNPWMLEYAQGLNAGRAFDLRYAPPGVNAELFRPLNQRALDVDPYILCVARLSDPRKKIRLLLESYARLPDLVRTKVRLVLAGSSGPNDDFWQHATELGLRDRINYVANPDSDDLVRLYQNASVFTLPSDEEGFGMVLIEAMACGIPVISTRSGGPDGIIEDGVDGFLVALDDAAEMAARLRVLLEDPMLNTEMGLRARQTVEDRYDERVAGAVFVEVWDRLLGQNMSAR